MVYRILLVGVLVSFFALFSGCDGFFNIKGVVYEWINPPIGASSTIYVTNLDPSSDMDQTLKRMTANISSDITKESLVNVEIAVGYTKSIDKTNWYFSNTTSNSTGEFEGFWTVTPYKTQIRVKASKTGYMEVYDDMENGGTSYRHVIVFILVRDNP